MNEAKDCDEIKNFYKLNEYVLPIKVSESTAAQINQNPF